MTTSKGGPAAAPHARGRSASDRQLAAALPDESGFLATASTQVTAQPGSHQRPDDTGQSGAAADIQQWRARPWLADGDPRGNTARQSAGAGTASAPGRAPRSGCGLVPFWRSDRGRPAAAAQLVTRQQVQPAARQAPRPAGLLRGSIGRQAASAGRVPPSGARVAAQEAGPSSGAPAAARSTPPGVTPEMRDACPSVCGRWRTTSAAPRRTAPSPAVVQILRQARFS